MNIKACSKGVNMKMDMARHDMHMHICIFKIRKRRSERGGGVLPNSGRVSLQNLYPPLAAFPPRHALPQRALTADAAPTLAAVRLQLPLSGERLRRARLLVARHL